MLLALTKAVRTQSAGIRDVDRKVGQLLPQDAIVKLIDERVAHCLTKDECREQFFQVECKASYASELIKDLDSQIRKVNLLMWEHDCCLTLSL